MGEESLWQDAQTHKGRKWKINKPEQHVGCKEKVTFLKLKYIIEDEDEHQPILTEKLKNDTNPSPSAPMMVEGNNTPNKPCYVTSLSNIVKSVDGIEGSMEEGEKIPEEQMETTWIPDKEEKVTTVVNRYYELRSK